MGKVIQNKQQLRSIMRHLFIWIVLLISFILLQLNQSSFLFSLISETINMAFYAAIVYFNWFYLIPNYLNEKQFLTYSSLLVIAALILSPLKIIFYSIIFNSQPDVIATVMKNQWWIFILLFLAGGISTIIKIARDWYKHQKEKTELLRSNMLSEISFLKSQINPHFLFNTLNSVYALSLKKSDKAPEMIVKLSEIMRYMLYESNEKKVDLNREIENIQNYLELERIRHSEDTVIDIQIEGKIENQKIAPLLLTPFIENAFKHGVKSTSGNDYVHIRIQIIDELIKFTCINNKSENYYELNPEKKGGIGLINVKRRLDLLYKDGYKLHLINKSDTFEVNLELNLNSFNNKF